MPRALSEDTVAVVRRCWLWDLRLCPRLDRSLPDLTFCESVSVRRQPFRAHSPPAQRAPRLYPSNNF